MTRLHIYGDESGNFDFSRNPGATRYFIVTTVTFGEHLSIEGDLLALRRELAWEGVDLRREFHATEDQQAVRDRVFGVIANHDFRIDATILDKPKAQPQTRVTDDHFFKTAWYFHIKYVAPRIAKAGDEMLVIVASLGTNRWRTAFSNEVSDVVAQVSRSSWTFRVAFWPAATDPLLQVADYCCWAIQRKWEHRDARSYDIIRDRISTEFDLFGTGTTQYY